MTDFITVSGSGEAVGIIQCADCGAAWLQGEEFVTTCPKCSSTALTEHDAVRSPHDRTSYIVVIESETHLI